MTYPLQDVPLLSTGLRPDGEGSGDEVSFYSDGEGRPPVGVLKELPIQCVLVRDKQKEVQLLTCHPLTLVMRQLPTLPGEKSPEQGCSNSVPSWACQGMQVMVLLSYNE
jgi:hypothetical protein